MFRQSVIRDAVGPYDESLVYSMDYELWRRVAARFPVANLDDYLVRLRASPRLMTSRLDEHTREGAWMRAAALADVLGWPPGDAEDNLRRALALYSLVTGDLSDLPPHALRSAASELTRLGQRFCDIYASSEGAMFNGAYERKELWRQLRSITRQYRRPRMYRILRLLRRLASTLRRRASCHFILSLWP